MSKEHERNTLLVLDFFCFSYLVLMVLTFYILGLNLCDLFLFFYIPILVILTFYILTLKLCFSRVLYPWCQDRRVEVIKEKRGKSILSYILTIKCRFLWSLYLSWRGELGGVILVFNYIEKSTLRSLKFIFICFEFLALL